MERSLALFAIGLVFGGGIGFVVAASNGVALDGHDHSSASDHQMQTTSVQLRTNHSGQTAGHDHNRTTSVPGGPDAPSLKISVSPARSAYFHEVICFDFDCHVEQTMCDQ